MDLTADDLLLVLSAKVKAGVRCRESSTHARDAVLFHLSADVFPPRT